MNGERYWYKNKNEKIDGDYIYKEGTGVYVGEFKGGVPDGRGEIKYPLFPDGEKYFGEWKDGEYHGQGTYSNYEEKYVGEWKDGKRNGQGTNSNVDRKDEEKGEWKDDVLWNGHSTRKEYFNMSSHFKVDQNFVYVGQYVGEIKYGERWNGTFYDGDGNISKKYVNGEYTDLDPTRNEPIEKKRGWWNILK